MWYILFLSFKPLIVLFPIVMRNESEMSIFIQGIIGHSSHRKYCQKSLELLERVLKENKSIISQFNLLLRVVFLNIIGLCITINCELFVKAMTSVLEKHAESKMTTKLALGLILLILTQNKSKFSL